jgi:DNA-binding LacI/PurR family transcriptional regulator
VSALYKKIEGRIISEIIESEEFDSGDILPSYNKLSERFGGSTMAVMMAVAELEKKGMLTRISPRKLAVASPEKIDSPRENTVGLIGFNGDLYDEFSKEIIHRLYDRNLFSYSMTPAGGEQNVERWYARFFSNKFQNLILRDLHAMPVKKVESYHGQFKQMIQVFSPYNKWKLPHHEVFFDNSFPCYDALKRLYAAGKRNVCIFSASRPPGCLKPRDRVEYGVERFLKEFGDSVKDMSVKIYVDFYEMLKSRTLIEKWISRLHPETDAIIGNSDYAVIKAQEWLHDYSSKIDYRKLCYVGRGNTSWSSQGVNRFPSYDYRLNDLIDLTLELIDSPSDKIVSRRIKPKAVRMQLLAGENEK